MPTQNLNAATNRSRQQAMVDNLDSLGTSVNEFFTEANLTAAESAVGNFIKRVHENLENQDLIVTGRIADIQIEQTANGFNVLANPQLVYQDAGVNGTENKSINDGKGYTDKRPPVQPFIEWIKARNIRAENNKKYYGEESPFQDVSEEQEIENMAYAMRENQFKNGIPAKKVYTKEIPSLIEELADEFAAFFIDTTIKNL